MSHEITVRRSPRPCALVSVITAGKSVVLGLVILTSLGAGPAIAQTSFRLNDSADDSSGVPTLAETEATAEHTKFTLWERAPLTEPISTDRPDFTESTDAVPLGHLQLETGYTFTYDREKGNRVRTHTAPEFLLRVGLMKNFELRLAWAGYTWAHHASSDGNGGGRSATPDGWEQGGHDFSVGFKYKFWEQDGLLPHFGIIGAIRTPSGSANVSSGDVDPEVVLLWAYDLTDAVSVAGNVVLATPTEDGHRFFQTAASLALAVALTDRLGTYVEYYGFYPNAHHSDCAHTLNGGFTYLITNDLQLDIRSGFGLNEEADDLLAGVGLSWRW